MKRFVQILALVLALTMLTGCFGGGEDTFTCNDLTMKVPGGLRDVSNQSDFSNFTFTLDSNKIAIFGLQESYAEYPVLSGYTLQDYANLVISSNELDCASYVREGRGYIYFSYAYNAEGAEYKYLTATYQSSQGYWMLQICSPAASYDEAEFLKILDSVTFK